MVKIHFCCANICTSQHKSTYTLTDFPGQSHNQLIWIKFNNLLKCIPLLDFEDSNNLLKAV